MTDSPPEIDQGGAIWDPAPTDRSRPAALTSDDDRRHDISGEFARESLLYAFLIPEEEMLGFVYCWVDERSRAGYIVKMVAGDNDTLAITAAEDVEVPRTADFDDWTVGDLTTRQTERLKRASISVSTPDLALEVEFSAHHEAFSYHQNRDGCPSYLATDRYEQTGRLQGTVTVDGRTIAFDTTCHRDHSWGPRDWFTMQDWKWIWGRAEDGTIIHAALIHGCGYTNMNGYVVRDGRTIAVDRNWADVEFDDDMWATRFRAVVHDVEGGRVEVEGERYVVSHFDTSTAAMSDSGCRGRIGDSPATLYIECGWGDQQYRINQIEQRQKTNQNAEGVIR